MSILIKGMEMPEEDNWRSIRIYPDGTIGRPIGFGDYALVEGAKAIPVPPHGRLIDADAIRADIDEKRPGRSYEDAWALTVLDSATTVLEAEEGE